MANFLGTVFYSALNNSNDSFPVISEDVISHTLGDKKDIRFIIHIIYQLIFFSCIKYIGKDILGNSFSYLEHFKCQCLEIVTVYGNLFFFIWNVTKCWLFIIKYYTKVSSMKCVYFAV